MCSDTKLIHFGINIHVYKCQRLPHHLKTLPLFTLAFRKNIRRNHTSRSPLVEQKQVFITVTILHNSNSINAILLKYNILYNLLTSRVADLLGIENPI